MVISLNEVYKKATLRYWCSSEGEVTVSGNPVPVISSPEALPPDVKYVYDHYWDKGGGALKYVVTYEGVTGLMLGWVFDYSWLEELGVLPPDLPAEDEEEVKAAFHFVVKDAAEFLSATCPYTVFYGRETDPDGDEILLFISHDRLTSNQAWANEEITRLTVGEDSMGARLYKRVQKAMCET